MFWGFFLRQKPPKRKNLQTDLFSKKQNLSIFILCCNKVLYLLRENPQLLLLLMNSLPQSMKGHVKSRFLTQRTYLRRCLIQTVLKESKKKKKKSSSGND